KGLVWYFSFFPEKKEGQLMGEFSPMYIELTQTAKRIKELFPDVKMIAIFRNPVERIYSMYWYNKIMGRGSLVVFDDFEQAVKMSPDLLQSALQGVQLKSYLEIFPENQIYSLLYDDIKNDPLIAMKGIFQFLEVDVSFVPPSLNTSINNFGSRYVRYPRLFKAMYVLYWKIRRIPFLFKLLNKLNTKEISKRLGRWGTRRIDKKIEDRK